MITSKQRALLISLAGKLDCNMQVGKEGIGSDSLVQIEAMLNKNELVKIRVLNNCPNTVVEIAEQASAQTNAQLVKIIGHIFVLYRRSTKPKVKHILD